MLLDLVGKQKELCHWSNKGPTSIGWTNVHRSFNEYTKLGYLKKQIQNKFTDLRRQFFNWHDGCTHTGLGHDPKIGEVAVPADRHYRQVSSELVEYAPWFDGCIGAIDGTHIPVEVNQEAKVDFINRNGEVLINVCAIVDMHGRFTYVGAGKADACHDMAVLQDCQADQDSRIHHQVCAYFSSL